MSDSVSSRSGLVERLARNSLFVFATRGIEIVASLAMVMLVTRYLKPGGYGLYSFVWAIVLVAQPLINFELNTILTREIARRRQAATELFGSALAMKWLFWLLFVAIVLVMNHRGMFEPAVRTALLITLAYELLSQHGMLFTGVFFGFEKMEYETFLTLLFRVITVAGTILVVVLHAGFTALFTVMLAGMLIRTLFGFILFRKCIEKARLPILPRLAGVQFLLKEAFFVTLGSSLTSLSLRVDILIMKSLDRVVDVALFNMPHTLILQLQILPTALVTALFPQFSRWESESRIKLARATELSFKMFTAVGCLLGLMITAFADQIVLVISGREFMSAALSLSILVWCVVILFLNYLATYLIISLKLQRLLIFGAIFTVVSNVGLDYLLIPRYGHVGASFATVCAYLGQVMIDIIILQRNLKEASILHCILKPAAATLPILPLVLWLRPLSLPLAALAALAIPLLLFRLLHIFTSQELDLFKRIPMIGRLWS